MTPKDGPISLRILAVAAAMFLIVAVPFLLKPKEDLLAKADETLVLISPHNEAVRHEFTVAFMRHYKEKTGRSIRLDWRTPGGTSEIHKHVIWTNLVAEAQDRSKNKADLRLDAYTRENEGAAA